MIYEASFTHVWTEVFESETLEEAKQMAEDRREAHEAIGTGVGKVTVGVVEPQETRIERERKDAEYKAWKDVQDRLQSQHPLQKRYLGTTYYCDGCLREEDTAEAFLDTSCLGWAVDLLELSANHDIGRHDWTTSVQVGDGPMGPEIHIYDRTCPRCIDERMRAGTPATATYGPPKPW